MSATPKPNLIPDDYSAPIFYNATSDWESFNYYQDVELENYAKHVAYQYDKEYVFVFLTPFFNETTDKKWTIMALEVGVIGLDVFLDNMVIIGHTNYLPDFKGKNPAAKTIKNDNITKRSQWNNRFFLQVQPKISSIKKYILLTIDEESYKEPEIIEKF